MKLIYLWIENYRNIKEQGYLLCASYDVKYDRAKNELSISVKDNIDRILYGDKISVTAIVGDNGAGKSTLLDAVRAVLFDKDRRGKEITGFLVWEDKGILNILSFMEEEKRLDVKSELEVSKCFPKEFILIYYSDFLDEKYYLEEFDDGEDEYTYIEEEGYSFRNRSSVQLNISTSYLLRKSGSSVLDYFHSDTKRQLDFYGSLQRLEHSLPFPAPVSLFVKIEFLEIDIFDRVLDASLQAYEYMGMGHHGEINTKAYVIGLLNKMEEAYQRKIIRNVEPLEAIQILQWDIFITYIYNLLAMRKQEHEEPHDYGQVDEIIKKVIFIETNEDIIWKELKRIFSEESTEEESFEDYLNLYHKIDWLLKSPKSGDSHTNFSFPDNMAQILSRNNPFPDLFPIIQEEDSGDMQDNPDRFPKEYNGWNRNWDRNAFMDFYDSYMKISYEIDFLKCSWGMSSGENNMFNLFARLHEALQRREKERVILIFDELDSSFHPQWQQKIMDSLTRFLRVNYPQKEFQVILTTHSPVLLSDIPRENVIFMGKENIVEAEHAQTFAANIASLYYDSFFMERGSIGEVARRSIVHLMEAISELEERGEKESFERDRGFRLFKCFLQKQYPKTEESILKNCMVKSEENARRLLQMLIDNIGENIWRYKANEQFHHFMEDNKVDSTKEIRSKLNELEKKEGREFVREFLKQWLREEER